MALHAPTFVAPGRATLSRTRRGPVSNRGRASTLVRNCGGCSRRELITGVVSGTGLNTARELEEAVSTKARTAYDQNFARTMENGMADYELHMRAVKDELFGNLSKFHDPRGTLVEIGMGTGPNMRYYEGLNVVGVEPNEESHVYAYENATKAGVKSLECVKGFGEALPLPDASVDTVVSTLVMCTVDDVEATLAEVRRVLKPGGAYIFLDHVAAPVGTPLRTMQEVLSPLNRVAYEGCRLTRDPEAAVKAEFGVENCEVNRFVAGSTAQSWLVGASPVDVAARWKETGGGLQPHFLLAPSVYGVARA